MIAKRPKVRKRKSPEGGNLKLGGMKGLVRYITRLSAYGVEPLTETAKITNSSAVTTDEFLDQVDLVQRRAKSGDKVYHLVVSFPPGEHPSPAVLEDIEQTLCERINAGDHQRISVLHEDTDCLHLHIAINRVHPTTFKLNAIHNDYAALASGCEQLEIKHRLTRTNHEMRVREGESRARSVTLHHGETPLLERAQALAPALVAATSWAEIYERLAEHGLTLRQRGAGLVVVDGEVGVKASNVAKDLSLGRLQARLGPFQPGPDGSRSSGAKPSGAEQGREGDRVGRPGADSRLRRQFVSERAATVAQRRETWALVREERATAMQAVRAAAAARQARLGAVATGPARWALAAAVRQEQSELLAQARAEASQRAAQARQQLSARPPTSWIDWLRARAASGDAEALAALRRAGAAPAQDGTSWISGGGSEGVEPAEDAGTSRMDDAHQAGWSDRLRHVSRRGVVTYEVGRHRVRDDGERLHLQGRPSDDAIAVALQLAKERHGTQLNVQGDVALRARIAHVAAQIDPSLRFDDPQTERLRVASMVVQQERRDGQGPGPGRGARADGVGRGPAGRPGMGSGQPIQVRPREGGAAAFNATDADRATLAFIRGRFPAGGIRGPVRLGDQPHLAASAAQPAASDRQAWRGRSVRDLPRLDLVRGAEHGAMSLPPAGRGDLGDRDLARDLPVRRPGEGDRAGHAAAPAGRDGLTAVERYVSERNNTRLHVQGLEPHRAFAGAEGPLTYAGRRVVDGETLVLLRSRDEVLVLPAHPEQTNSVGRFKNGQSVEVRDGRVVTVRSANTTQRPDNTATTGEAAEHGRAPRKRPTR